MTRLERIQRRASALRELQQHPVHYDARCERAGWEPGTPPRVLAEDEVDRESVSEQMGEDL